MCVWMTCFFLSLPHSLYVAEQWEQALDCLEDSVVAIKDIFGEDSIEMANELMKAADLQFNAKHWIDYKNTLTKARSIYSENYGESCEDVRRCDEMLEKAAAE